MAIICEQLDTSKHFVENFAYALQDRNGAVARMFLSPKIREQIKPVVIGPSTPVKKIEVNEIASNNDSWIYNVKAYYSAYGNMPLTLAFEVNVTVDPERYPDGSVGADRYFITKLDWVSGKSEYLSD
ncbi:hypothetical protein [Thermoanaerobacter mathranii]|uniref:hypothetical protein n=1 Tax=Thermoanaerobacter mathranii TaxID=583357 RepID=UPI003D6A8213